MPEQRLLFRTALLLVWLLAGAASLPAQNALTPEQWREDLHYLAQQVPAKNPRAFHSVTREQFEAAVADLDRKIPELSDHEVELALVGLVARLGEGHSRISLPGLPDPMSDVADLTPSKDTRLAFHRLPVRLHWFSDGLFVVSATPEFRSLLGARVTEIGDSPVQKVLDAVTPLINRDNDMGRRYIAPDLVVVPEVLQVLHIIADDSRVRLGLVAGGKEREVELSPLPTGSAPVWVDPFQEGRLPPPRYFLHRDKDLWMEYLPAAQTLWVGVHVIRGSADEPVSSFAHRLETLARTRRVDRFVIDLRDCHGGDNQQFRALLLALVRSPKLNQPGRTFTLIDRGTFSAAVNAASDLERLSNTLFVGEPTAGSPSSWGDPRKVTLPNSGLIARISTIYWRDWTTDESRPWLAPDLPLPDSSAAYFAGHDPALDLVARFQPGNDFGSLLSAVVRGGGGTDGIVRLYYQRKNDPLWAGEPTEKALEALGELLISRHEYETALLVFQVNAQDYPRSLSSAIAAVDRAAKARPGDQDLAKLLTRLKSLAEGAK